MKRAFVIVLLLLAPLSAAAQSVPRGLDEYIEKARTDWGVVGLAVAVVKDDSVVYAKGFGLRELGKSAAVDAYTLFAIGSNTKAFTAAVIGTLVDAGKMNWDDPVTRYLPGFQLYDPYASRELTIRDVLSHRSGLSRGDQLWYATPFTRQEVLQRVRYLEPSWSFRSRYGYQNIMFLAAGEAAASAAGKSWQDLIAQKLFQPLGMTLSNTSVNDLAKASDVASPHAKVAGNAAPIAYRNIDNVGPAGSINSNVLEMSQWLRLLLGNGSYKGQRVLSERIVREMLTPHTITGSGMDTIFPMSHFSVYGQGLGMRDYYGRKLVSHTGGIDGMLSVVAFVPEEKLGVVVLTNTDDHNAAPAIAYWVIDRFMKQPARDWSATFLKLDAHARQRADSVEADLLRARVADTRPSLPPAEHAGKYEHRMYGEVRIRDQNGELRFDRYGVFTGRLEHWHFDTYRVAYDEPRLGKQMVTFMLSAAGKISGLRMEGLGEFAKVNESVRAAAR